MLHTRTKEDFATIITIDGCHIDRETAVKVLGVWIGEDPSTLDLNRKQTKKRLYASMSILTKLKYAGLSKTKILHFYTSHVGSSMEYCLVVWHDSLTQAQSVRIWEVGAKRSLNSTSRVNRPTNIQTHRHTDGHFDL